MRTRRELATSDPHLIGLSTKGGAVAMAWMPKGPGVTLLPGGSPRPQAAFV
jgi:hypothetical protein